MATVEKVAPTDRQRELLAFLWSYYDAKGYPPTLREMGEALGLASPCGAVCHLKALERKGFVRHTERRGRGTSPAWMLVREARESA